MTMTSKTARAAFAIAALAAAVSALPAHAAVKAAYVEEVIPARTYYDSMAVVNGVRTIGPGSGTWGVTSITLTNFDSGPQQVFVFAPVLNASGCSASVIGGSSPRMIVYVQPQQTLHLTYPTPLVFGPGVSCISAEVTTILHGGSVEVDVNGVVN